jgi:hypothetical protein
MIKARLLHAAISWSVLFFSTTISSAQTKLDLAGDYSGQLGQVPVELHLVSAGNGTLSGTVDSPKQNLFGMPCTDLNVNGKSLSFAVPMVHGIWSGVIGDDGALLAGIWSQGSSTTPLSLSRVHAGTALPVNADQPKPNASVTQGNAVAHAATPACALSSAISYWDGSSWKPMLRADTKGGEGGVDMHDLIRDPFRVHSRNAGFKTTYTYSGAVSALTLGPDAKFCVAVGSNERPHVMIGNVDVKGGNRQIEITHADQENPDGWIPANRAQKLDIQRVSDNAVVITAATPLAPGQYILTGFLMPAYDFGVR